jgi:hypothetical protein
MTRLSKGLIPYLAASHKCVRSSPPQTSSRDDREFTGNYLRCVRKLPTTDIVQRRTANLRGIICAVKTLVRPIGCKLHTGTWWFDTP